MTKQTIRKAIMDELQRQGHTPYWMAKQLGMHHQSIYRVFTSDDCSGETLERMCVVLGLEVTNPVPPKGKP